MKGTDERPCNGPIRLSVIGCSSTALYFELGLWRRNAEQRISGYGTDNTPGGQTMTDQQVAGQLKALAEDYERRAEKAAPADAAKTLARSAARECERMAE